MKIRTRLLLLILPTVLGIILSISYLSYRTWYNETLAHFKISLEAIAVSCAEIIDWEAHEWIFAHKDDSKIIESRQYQEHIRALKNVRQKLPVTSIYTVRIEPVPIGQPVLSKQPISEKNRINDGKDPLTAYRQVYVLDTGGLSNEPFHPPGDEDYSESGEIQVYRTKQPFVTPIYESKASGMRFMTAFAPIIDKNGDVIALVAADLSLEVLDKNAQEIQGFIVLGATLTMILIMTGLAFIANNISQPVEQLKNAALTLAAGNYGKKIEVKGPQEISELANTLNTMSECLREHITRLEESSILREKMIGEVECVRILQTKLIQAVADSFTHSNIKLKAIGITARLPHKALVLEVTENRPSHVTFSLKEASQNGFAGIYELICNKKPGASIDVSLEKENSHWQLAFKNKHTPPPLVWSTKKGEIIVAKSGMSVLPNDFIIIVNEELDNLIREEDSIMNWFARVFRHFADEGIEACSTLLANELAFLSGRHELNGPLQAICIEIMP